MKNLQINEVDAITMIQALDTYIMFYKTFPIPGSEEKQVEQIERARRIKGGLNSALGEAGFGDKWGVNEGVNDGANRIKWNTELLENHPDFCRKFIPENEWPEQYRTERKQ